MGKRSKCVLITAGVIVMLSGCQKTQTVPLEERSEFLSEETACAENRETDPEVSSETARGTSKEPVVLSFHDMYSSTSSSRGLQFSEAFVCPIYAEHFGHVQPGGNGTGGMDRGRSGNSGGTFSITDPVPPCVSNKCHKGTDCCIKGAETQKRR